MIVIILLLEWGCFRTLPGMSNLFPTSLRRTGAVVAGSALLLGSALLGPTAIADDDDSFYGLSANMSLDLVLHEDELVDMSISTGIDGIDPSLYCTEDMLSLSGISDDDIAELGDEAKVDVAAQGDSCALTVTGASLDAFNSSDSPITHEGDEYIVDFGDLGDAGDYLSSISISVTFPGKVTEADDSATIDGNKVTWDDLTDAGTIRAVGKDSAGKSSAVWIALVVVALLVIAGVVAFIVSRNRKKNAAPVTGYPGAGYPAQPQQPGQQGYVPSRSSPANSHTVPRSSPASRDTQPAAIPARRPQRPALSEPIRDAHAPSTGRVGVALVATEEVPYTLSMSILSPVALRRAGSVVAGSALLLGSVLVGPLAVADDGDASAHIDLTLYENKTADLVMTIDIEASAPTTTARRMCSALMSSSTSRTPTTTSR
ncbi:hypothetical protein BW737_004755 [Actinomyces ruminis]|uniref:LppM domain-containing protein n=1 Tax=Actinomyces ruminis TaxID=1937003 RepID=A0ABX4MDB1_9ACTO|nr:hypothetical protein BW737_004755 [Actinomyces ruminis]